MTDVLSRRDLDFLLYEWLNVTDLITRARFAEHSKATFDAVLDLSADLAHQYFATHNKTADAHEPTMRPDGTVDMIPEVRRALDAYARSGLIAGQFDESLGGIQLPTTVARASMAWFQAANAGTAAYPFLTVANANLIAAHGTAEQIDQYVRPMVEGRWFGTMCLSEPQAGSSLSDITSRAVRQDGGSYRLTGTKMWISGGDHELTENIVHLVLAKTPGGGPGVKSISLFIVPKCLPGTEPGTLGERNDITLVGLNHKMGNRGTTNALLAFGDGTHTPGGHPGAVGFLVGEEHRGLSYMFHMMNEARIGVGFLATALGYVGYRKSLEYARSRIQGRSLGADGLVAPVPIIEHPDVRRLLLAQKAYVEGALALGLYCARLVDEQDTADSEAAAAEATSLLDILTPIAKSWPSQWCLEANNLAIQVHGGCGYTRDFDVEQHYRDNRLNPIHEGTQGIQGLDLLGRKVTQQGGSGLRLLGTKIVGVVERARALGGDAATHADALDVTWNRIADVTAALWESGDPATALANSSIYLEAFGHTVIAWMWLEQLIATDGKSGDFYDGKRMAARFFFVHELPKVRPQLDLLANNDQTTSVMDPRWF